MVCNLDKKGVVGVQNGCILASATGVLNIPENFRSQFVFKIAVAKTKANTQSTLFLEPQITH